MTTSEIQDITQAITFIGDTSFTLSIAFFPLGVAFGYLLHDLKDLSGHFNKRGKQ
jgi:hypothetical protein